MKSKFKKILTILICFILVICFSLSVSYVYADDDEKETDTFSGGLGSLFRQLWITLLTFFENHAKGTDQTTIFYEISLNSSFVNICDMNRNILNFI